MNLAFAGLGALAGLVDPVTPEGVAVVCVAPADAPTPAFALVVPEPFDVLDPELPQPAARLVSPTRQAIRQGARRTFLNRPRPKAGRP
jgi:hypothetical protein